MKKIISILLCLTMLLGMAAVVSATPAGDNVIINEVYGGGGNSGAPYTYDFVELYNPTNNDISLKGWTLQYASATGSFGSNTFKFSDDAVIKAGDYYLVQLAPGTTVTNQPLPGYDASGNLNLSGTKGKIALANNSTTVTSATSSNVVDFVGFGSANAYEGSPTTAPSNSTSVTRTNFVDTDNNKNDFKTGTPTPQKSTEVNHTHDSSVFQFTDEGHWTECSCGENKSDVTAHTLVNHVCECGFVGNPETVDEIIACLYALPSGSSIPGSKTLTGTVSSIGEAWSTQYSNITVTMTVEGHEDQPIVCYRLKTGAADASAIEVGDTITVTGTLTNYNGTKEFNSGCVLDALTKPTTDGGEGGEGEGGEGEGGGEVVNPGEGEGGEGGEGETTGTLAEQIAEASKLANGEYLTVVSTITGTITDEPQASSKVEGQYKFTVSDGTNTLLCYFVPVTGGVPAKGDSITVTGYLTAYNGSAQFDEHQATATLNTNPGTGDSFSSIVVAMMAISAIGAGIVISKKKEF